SARVLTGEPERRAFAKQAGIGERLAASPVDALAALHHLVALLEKLQHPRMRCEALGQALQRLRRLAEIGGRDACVRAPVRTGPLQSLPNPAEREHLL